jgi:CheY-like chemotaxis protein
MPGTEGASLAAAVKRDPAIQKTIVVILASVGNWRAIRRLDGAPADACLVKPLRQSQLLEALSNAWSKRGLATLATRVETPSQPPPGQSPARVLVADDNVISQKVAVRMLESLGLRADVSANGREAVEMLRLLPYDLVLMDCKMPFMNGQEAATEIRKREPPGRHTPIIAMTAETGPDCLDSCLASGIDDLMLKPIRMEVLMSALHRWLPAEHEEHWQPVTPTSKIVFSP